MLLLLLLLSLAAEVRGISLETKGNSQRKITVSGVSSGGFFAVQFHVAHSSIIQGAGIIAGGPFYCAQGNVEIALSSCMKNPELISVDELVGITRTTYLTTRTIDNPENLSSDDRVWLFTGSKDTVVNSGVVHKLEAYYASFGVDAIQLVDSVPAEHSWVTSNYGNKCAYKGEPYINSCQYDSAGKLLDYLHSAGDGSPAEPPRQNASLSGKIVEIDQSVFTPPGVVPAEVGLAKAAYAFIPSGCSTDRASSCDIHIAFHGCHQGTAPIGMKFVENTGLNAYADAHGIIILYPQAVKTPLNPNGCWDWWGYSGEDYASKIGVQMSTVKAMLDSMLPEQASN